MSWWKGWSSNWGGKGGSPNWGGKGWAPPGWSQLGGATPGPKRQAQGPPVKKSHTKPKAPARDPRETDPLYKTAPTGWQGGQRKGKSQLWKNYRNWLSKQIYRDFKDCLAEGLAFDIHVWYIEKGSPAAYRAANPSTIFSDDDLIHTADLVIGGLLLCIQNREIWSMNPERLWRWGNTETARALALNLIDCFVFLDLLLDHVCGLGS